MFRKIIFYLLIIMLFFTVMGTVSFAVDDTDSVDKYRIQALRKELEGISPEMIEQSLARYKDMDSHWSRQVVGKLTCLGAVNGKGDVFDPNGELLANQFIKMVVLAIGHNVEPDSSKGWDEPYIEIALQERIIREGQIKDYNAPITREMMAQILVKAAAKIESMPDNRYASYIANQIYDFFDIYDMYKQYVLDAYCLGLLRGSDNYFRPKDTLTRAEGAAAVIRLIDLSERVPVRPGPEENEYIELIDAAGNPVYVYPSHIRECFDTQIVMKNKLNYSKGFTAMYYSPSTKSVIVSVYESREAWESDPLHNLIADFISTNGSSKYAYTLYVWQPDKYKVYFADYVREILRYLYGKDADKAVALHEKYLNLDTYKSDGGNYYENANLNGRPTFFIGDPDGFSIYIEAKR